MALSAAVSGLGADILLSCLRIFILLKFQFTRVVQHRGAGVMDRHQHRDFAGIGVGVDTGLLQKHKIEICSSAVLVSLFDTSTGVLLVSVSVCRHHKKPVLHNPSQQLLQLFLERVETLK